MEKTVRVSILGLGLIGGSLAKTLKGSSGHYLISAFDRESVIKRALSESVIDEPLNCIEDASETDLIMLCLPTLLNLDAMQRLGPIMRKGSILSDVSSVKLAPKESWLRLKAKSEGVYFGGHPMTGKEKGGYTESDRLLFENCIYLLDSEAENNKKAAPLAELISDLGAQIRFIAPEEHDIALSRVSHLPQLLSVALINSALKTGDFGGLAAGGFRDMTRIASSPYDIWDSIVRLNREKILDALDSFIMETQFIRESIKSGDFSKIETEFMEANRLRAAVPKDTKGFIHSLYDLYLFVSDEPGVISRISSGLFSIGLNIKDIELLKIREGTGGTFRLSFDSPESLGKARAHLQKEGFVLA